MFAFKCFKKIGVCNVKSLLILQVEWLQTTDEAGAAGTWLLVTVFCQAVVRATKLCNPDTQALVFSFLLMVALASVSFQVKFQEFGLDSFF